MKSVYKIVANDNQSHLGRDTECLVEARNPGEAATKAKALLCRAHGAYKTAVTIDKVIRLGVLAR